MQLIKLTNFTNLYNPQALQPTKLMLSGAIATALLGMSGCAVVHEVAVEMGSGDVTADLATATWSDENKARLERYPECKEKKNVMKCISQKEAQADREYEAQLEARRTELHEEELAKKAKEHEEWLATPEGIAHTEAEAKKAAEKKEQDAKMEARAKDECMFVAQDFTRQYDVKFQALRYWQHMYDSMILCSADYVHEDVYGVESYKIITFEYNSSTKKYKWRE